MKHTVFTRLTILAALLMSVLSFSTSLAPRAYALDCAILPQSICKAATTNPTDANNKGAVDVKKTGVFLLLVWVLNILTAGIGIAAVGALIYAGILYSSAGGGSDQIAKSKKIITDTVIGIVAYGLMFLVLNWLIPGGVIG